MLSFKAMQKESYMYLKTFINQILIFNLTICQSERMQYIIIGELWELIVLFPKENAEGCFLYSWLCF